MKSLLVLGVIVGLIGFSTTAKAEEPTVSATGVASIKKQPARMRLSVDLTATGKDVREASSKLQQQRDSMKEKLVGLKASAESIKLGEMSIGTGGNLTEQQKRMQAMMEMARGSKAKKPVTTVTVSSSLEAEFVLGSGDDALIAAKDLEDKVRELFKKSDEKAENMSPEEQELAEEMAQVDTGRGGSKPGEPRITYVATISDEELARVTKEALTRARAEAATLAAASGLQLGGIHELSSGAARASGAYAEYFAMMTGENGQEEKAPHEATGTQYGTLRFHKQLTVRYKLVP